MITPTINQRAIMMMHLNSDQWFTELSKEHGSAFSFQIKQLLQEVRTPYQTIQIYDSTYFGHVMVIDNFIMLTQKDNYVYHEMMAHPVLYTHPKPQSVLIIGGGDCGTLREVARHAKLSKIVQVEIDQQVTELSRKYFPELCTANEQSRVQLIYQDAIEWVAQCPQQTFDVIIVDSTDPIGPAEGLFTANFYQNCRRALHPEGILIHQSESPLYHSALIKAIHKAMYQAEFTQLQTILFPAPTYPSGWWSATMASVSTDLSQFRIQDAIEDRLPTQYYNAAIHQGSLALPNHLQAMLDATKQRYCLNTFK